MAEGRVPAVDATDHVATLDDLRNDIDRVDEVLVRLLNERARVRVRDRPAEEGARASRSTSRIARSEVLAHVRGIAAEGPLGPDAIARLFERIIDEARRLERRVVHDERAMPSDGSRDDERSSDWRRQKPWSS